MCSDDSDSQMHARDTQRLARKMEHVSTTTSENVIMPEAFRVGDRYHLFGWFTDRKPIRDDQNNRRHDKIILRFVALFFFKKKDITLL